MNTKWPRSCGLHQCLPFLLLLLALTGCTVTLPPTVPTEPTTAQEPLTNTSWQLTAIGDTNALLGATGNPVTLTFSADGQVGGTAGCNSYGGNYAIEGDTITFTEIVSTLIACSDAAVMAQEEQYLAALNSTEHFTLAGDQLTIWSDNDSNRLTFTLSDAAIPATTVTEATATPATPATSLPTVTPAPTTGNSDDPTAETTRITFAPGATRAEINGKLAEHNTDYYVLQAQQGQIMSVEITSPNGDVLLSVVGADGTPYKRYQNGPPSWTSTLPATQDYYLHAVSVGPATAYTLRVWIEPVSDTGGAERIEFAPGETTASRSGALPEGGVKEYILAASAGQTMHVQTVGYGAPVEFTVRSPSGTAWPGTAQSSDVYIMTAEVVLPENGDYVVTLSLPATAGATRYDVTFTIAAGSAVATPVPNTEAERVEFAAGATSAERSGLLPSGPGTLQYVLTANEGQIITVDATSDGVPLSMIIAEPNGYQMIPEMHRVEGGYAIGAQLTLPATGDYVVTLNKGDHSSSTNYKVTFTIE